MAVLLWCIPLNGWGQLWACVVLPRSERDAHYAHASWSLFIDVSLGVVTREESDGRAEPVAVLRCRERVCRILHRADVLDVDVACGRGVRGPTCLACAVAG